jgi:hypothetical protein
MPQLYPPEDYRAIRRWSYRHLDAARKLHKIDRSPPALACEEDSQWIITDLLNSLYQNCFYMNVARRHRIICANTAHD